MAEAVPGGKVGPPIPGGIFNRGGRFGDLFPDTKPGEVGNHMPQNAFLRTVGEKRNDGPALGMFDEDHAKTRTTNGKGKRTMRLDKGLSARDRLALDIKDNKRLFGRRYNKGLLEAVKHAKRLARFRK
jgi:hypothetical protein